MKFWFVHSQMIQWIKILILRLLPGIFIDVYDSTQNILLLRLLKKKKLFYVTYKLFSLHGRSHCHDSNIAVYTWRRGLCFCFVYLYWEYLNCFNSQIVSNVSLCWMAAKQLSLYQGCFNALNALFFFDLDWKSLFVNLKIQKSSL